MKLRDVKIDKSTIRVYSSFAEADEADRQYWRNKTPGERLEALEMMRQSVGGYDSDDDP